MAQDVDSPGGDASSTTTSTKAPAGDTPSNNYHDTPDYNSSPTDTVAAVTIAVLAVVVIVALVLVCRALRKRRRARQGEQFGHGHIPTLTTGIMGTGATAYSVNPNISGVPVRGALQWEPVNPSVGGENSDTQDAHSSTSPS